MDAIWEHEKVHNIPFRLFTEIHWRAMTPMPPDTQVLGDVRATVNHGRWIVGCPTRGCNSAQLASPTDPMFACVLCGSGWWRVIFPRDKQAIEATLLRRPLVGGLPSTRHWTRETILELVRENTDRRL